MWLYVVLAMDNQPYICFVVVINDDVYDDDADDYDYDDDADEADDDDECAVITVYGSRDNSDVQLCPSDGFGDVPDHA